MEAPRESGSANRGPPPMGARPVSRAMRAFLWVAIALTFAAGTQLVVLAELGIARFGGDLELARVSAWAYFAFIATALVVGAAGARLAWRDGRYAPVRRQGWIPVELRDPKPEGSRSPEGRGSGSRPEAAGRR